MDQSAAQIRRRHACASRSALIYVVLIAALSVLPAPASLAQFPSLPVRIGGAVTVDGTLLSVATVDRYEFDVSLQTTGAQLASTIGLTASGGYAVDVPAFNAVSQPTGVTVGGRVVVTVRRNGQTLSVVQPVGGFVTVGAPGTITVANLVLVAAQSRLVNLSIRSNAGAGAQTLIVGFNLSSGSAKQLLIRGIGPTLSGFGVGGALADPQLQLFSGSTVVAANDNWGGGTTISATSASVGAFALPGTSRDAVLLQTLNSGGYTAQIGGGSGVALVELYDAGGASGAKLTNVSARTQVGTGGDILIAGFSIGGTTSKTLLIRAVGPTLGSFGVTGVLADPRLDLFSGATLIQSNDNWGGTAALAGAFTQVGAFNFPPASRDAAVLVTLQPGSYTAQIRGVNNSTGVALVEVYELP